ncbi:MAG: hypothetical protein K6T75_09060 [Acetobacteraceae bacterium]|nr:hypothetical protein [Acetobacteraceae bacterium]
MSDVPVRFGTDGWRGVLGEDFTWAGVERALSGIAAYLEGLGGGERALVVACDCRFMGQRLARRAAELLASWGITALLAPRPLPSPVAGFAVRHWRASGAVVFTASHNPPEYQGLKFLGPGGGPAPPEVTRAVEEAASRPVRPPAASSAGTLTINPARPYLDHVRTLLGLTVLASRPAAVVVDPMHGAGRGYLERLLGDVGWRVVSVRARPDPLFGGMPPDPAPAALARLGERVKTEGAVLGLALDGDADRFGVVDSDGRWQSPNRILGLLYLYLLRGRRLKGGVARTVATTHRLDDIARAEGQPVVETPVGFKYLGPYLERGDALFAGEESGGMSLRGHLPAKDGVLACALAAEMVAAAGRSLEQLSAEADREFGPRESVRLDLPLRQVDRTAVAHLLDAGAFDRLGGRPVVSRDTTDGWKFRLEGGAWFLVRLSGTESRVVRIYVEAESEGEARRLAEEAARLLGLGQAAGAARRQAGPGTY